MRSLFVWALLFLVCCSRASPRGLPGLVRQVKPSVVTIDVYDRDREFLETGSGFFISHNILVSSRHVFFKATNPPTASKAPHFAQARTPDRQSPSEYSIKHVLIDDAESDLIVFSVEAANPLQPSLPIATVIPEEGEDIFVVSSPSGLEGIVTNGIVSAIHNEFDMQISAPIGTGSSGAPVFNYDGEVVGIVSGFLASAQNMNFAVTAFRLKLILSRLLPDNSEGTTPAIGSGSPSSGAMTLPQWVQCMESSRNNSVNSSTALTGFSRLLSNLKDYTRGFFGVAVKEHASTPNPVCSASAGPPKPATSTAATTRSTRPRNTQPLSDGDDN